MHGGKLPCAFLCFRIKIFGFQKLRVLEPFAFYLFDIGRGRLLIQCGAVIEIRFV